MKDYDFIVFPDGYLAEHKFPMGEDSGDMMTVVRWKGDDGSPMTCSVYQDTVTFGMTKADYKALFGILGYALGLSLRFPGSQMFLAICMFLYKLKRVTPEGL